MKKVVRLTESDLERLIKRVINEQTNPQGGGKLVFDMNQQSTLRKWGFKDMNPLPDEFIRKGTPTVIVKAVPCKQYGGKIPGMKIYVDGKDFQSGKYEVCGEKPWIILAQMLDIPGYENY